MGSDASLHLFPLNSGSDFSLSIIAKAMPLSKCLLFYSQPIGFLNKCIMIIFGGDDDCLENYRKYLPIKRIFSSLNLPHSRQEPLILTMRSGQAESKYGGFTKIRGHDVSNSKN